MTPNQTIVGLVKALYETPSFKTKAALANAYLTGKDIPVRNRTFGIELYRECEREWPDSFKACHEGLHALAIDHLLRGEYDDADRYFRAIPLVRLKSGILLCMGMWHHQDGRCAFAEPYLKEYVAKADDRVTRDVVVNLLVGYLRMRSDKTEFVRQMLSLYRQHVPLSVENVEGLASVLSTDRHWDREKLAFATDYYWRTKGSSMRDRLALRIVEDHESRGDLDTALLWAETAGLKEKARQLEMRLHPPSPRHGFMSAFQRWLKRLVRRLRQRLNRTRRLP